MLSEVDQRKARSELRLTNAGISILDSLPSIESAEDSHRRVSRDVAVRAIILLLLSIRYKALDDAALQGFIKDFDLQDSLTRKEKEYVENAKPSEKQIVAFSWRLESYWALLWALGFLESLELPFQECDMNKAVSVLREFGFDKFTEKAKLRPQDELLDELDFTYRCHWAIRESERGNKDIKIGKLNRGVVMERHYALNWLALPVDWDKVPTDT